MRSVLAQAAGLLLLLSSLLLGVTALAEPTLLVGVVGALLVAWGAARHAAVVLPSAGGGPAASVRDHHRALARRAVPRQRDPDAAGHTRSRAPSELLPAA